MFQRCYLMVCSLRRLGFKMGRLRGSKSHFTSIKLCPLARYSDSFFGRNSSGWPISNPRRRKGGEWQCGMAEATAPWYQCVQAFVVVLAQVDEEGLQAEGEEEQGLEAAPGRAEAGPGQEAEEVCCCAAGSFLGACMSERDIPTICTCPFKPGMWHIT